MTNPIHALSLRAALLAPLALAVSVVPAQSRGEARYQAQLESLQSALQRKIPKVRAASEKAFAKAREAEKTAKRALEDAQKALGEVVQVSLKRDGEKHQVTPGDHFIHICQQELEASWGQQTQI